MPLYQMLCITRHYGEYSRIRELVRQSCLHLLDSGSVVRSLDFWGTKTLPQRMRRHKEWHYTGDYWTVHFDTAPRTVRSLNQLMRQDPRVIRWTVVKLANKAEDVAKWGEIVKKSSFIKQEHLS